MVRYRSTGPPRYNVKQSTASQPRPFAYQPTPQDYQPTPGPKLSPSEIAAAARREGEILSAHRVKISASQMDKLQAKVMFEPQRMEAAKARSQEAAPAVKQEPPTRATEPQQQKQPKTAPAQPARSAQTAQKQHTPSAKMAEYLRQKAQAITKVGQQLSEKGKAMLQKRAQTQSRAAEPQKQKDKSREK